MSTVTKNVHIHVDLDDKNIPEKISMHADDSGSDKPIGCRAMILAMWDNNKKETLRLDLWTKDMTVDEMRLFFHETLVTMADTLQSSTGDERISGDMRDFCDYFAEKMEIRTG
jgi:gliding motility-associated protein GldC